MSPFSLTAEQIQQVIDRTEYYVELANQRLKLKLADISVKFDLKGRASGMFVVRGQQVCIRYNQIIFSRYYDDNLENTVAHEVAHYVVHCVWGMKNAKPHGREWKQVMAVFNVKPEVTSQYDVSDLPLNRQRQHEYVCGCMSHHLSTTRHYKVLRKQAVYKCRKCLQALTWSDEAALS